MPFDPSQPYDVVTPGKPPAFDPSKPFKKVEPAGKTVTATAAATAPKLSPIQVDPYGAARAAGRSTR